MDLQKQLRDSYVIQGEMPEKLKYIKLEMKKGQDPASKHNLASARVETLKDLTNGEQKTKLTHSTKITTSGDYIFIYWNINSAI